MNKKLLTIAVVLILLIAIVAGAFMIFTPEQRQSERMNILLLGADARTPANQGFTDSITIFSIDKKTKEVSMLSIPRDSRVQIYGKGVDKINHAYAYGDINTTIKTVENFLDVKIDYYVLVDFTDFKKLVDSVGGITMDVEPHVSAVRPELHGKTGVSRLTGEEALTYVRFRQDNQSEAGRMKRHREAIQAIINEVLKPSNILDAPSNFNQLRTMVKTDLPYFDPTIVQQFATGFNMDNAKIGVVTGEYRHINGINYMIPNMEETEKTVVELGLRK